MSLSERFNIWSVLGLLPLVSASVRAATSAAAAPSDDEWGPRPLKSLDTTTCSVGRAAAADLTPQRFAQEYRGKKPVVIAGLTNVDVLDRERLRVGLDERDHQAQRRAAVLRPVQR